MRPLIINLPSALHREMFQIGLAEAKKKYGEPADEGKALYLFYEAAKFTWERYPDEDTHTAMMALLILWQRDYCKVGADLTENTLAIH